MFLKNALILSFPLLALTLRAEPTNVIEPFTAASDGGAGIAEPPAADGFERPPVLQADAILRPPYLQSPSHTVDREVPTYLGRNSYTIRSPYGTFYAEGNYELETRVREVQAMGQLEELSKSDLYVEALKNAAKSPVQFAGDLARHPVKTVAGVPRGVFKFLDRAGHSIEEKVDGRPKNDYEDSSVQNAIGFSKAKRELCAQLGINPYTSNEALQKELNGLAWAVYAGKMTFSAALMPVGGTLGQVATGVNLSTTASQALRDLDPVDLREKNGKELREMGIAPDVVARFLAHPAYSPVYQTALVDALAKLSGVKGREALLAAANDASEEADAIFFMRSASLMAQLHAQKPLETITVIEGLPVCTRKDGGLVIPLEWDYACWSRSAAAFSDRVRASFKGRKPTGEIELAITGIASPRLRQELASRQIRLTEKALPGPLR